MGLAQRAAARAAAVLGAVCLVVTLAVTPEARAAGGFVSATASSSQSGYPPQNAIDGDLSTRWMASGQGQFLTGDMGAVQTVTALSIAWYRGGSRRYSFQIEVAGPDGTSFQPVFSGTSSGATSAPETYAFAPVQARFVRVVVNGNTVNNRDAIREVAAQFSSTSPSVAVAVSPSAATVAPGGQQQFTASVTNASDTSVTWSLQEGASGGTIDASGLYTAPSTAGTFHVVATSVADPTKSANATVTVQASGGGGGTGGGDLCAGLVQDELAHPMTSVAKPAVGKTFVDPQFGTTIRRISDASASGAANIVPMYSTVQAWNADESYLILYWSGGGHHLYDGRTYAHIKALNIDPADLEQVYWDTVDPKTLYFVGSGTTRLYAYNVDTGAQTLLHDFATAPSSCSSSVSGGTDPMWTSWDSDHFGFVCGSKIFSYDRSTNTVGGVASVSTGGNAPQAGPGGALYYLNRNDAAGEIRDGTMTLQRTISSFSSAEHATLGTAGGADTLFSVQFDGTPNGTIVAVDLATAAKRVIIGPATGWPYPPGGTHLSAIAYRNPGWVTASIVGSGTGQAVLDDEIVLADANDGGAVCRVAHHRSAAHDYWAEPHVTISPSGTRLLFGSDWGGSVSDAYVVELPGYAAP